MAASAPFATAFSLPAGKNTIAINSSFTAYDYKQEKLNPARSFLMDDYVRTGRVTKRCELDESVKHLKQDSCWPLIQSGQRDTAPFEAKQGFSETKFHAGFMRRQAANIPYLAERPSIPAALPLERSKSISVEPLERPGRRRAPEAAAHDVITGSGITENLRHSERRHVVDAAAARAARMHADTPGGRLRDSTARFFCTPDQMPRRDAREKQLDADGLTVTKRTSTVIGVGANPSQEIFSIGAREALHDSLYGLQRRGGGKADAHQRAADAALVKALS